MRMEQAGPSAADLVNTAPEALIADILHQYGEERAARRIARAIVAARKVRPFATTLELAAVVERCLPRPKPGQPHPATRSFQALRIAVNDELGELARGLIAAEAALAPGGWLAVVTFHSLEDRIVKRFLQLRSGAAPRASRYAPEARAEVAGLCAGDPQGGRRGRCRSRGQSQGAFGEAADRAPAGRAGRAGRSRAARVCRRLVEAGDRP